MCQTVKFAASWDLRLRLCTPLIAALIIVLAVFLPVKTPWLRVVEAMLPIGLLGLWAWAPRAYRVDRGNLIVERPVGDLLISLADLRSARLMRPGETGGAMRIWAVGGCFGYYGRFLNGIETQTWYVTDTEKCVRLECVAEVFVVSPSDPAAFLSALPAPHGSARAS
jgi:hypothetical protein